MSKKTYRQIIDALALSYGIEPEYTDNWGRLHPTSLETKCNVLKAFGAKVDTEAQTKDTWHGRINSHSSRMTEPVIVARLDRLPSRLAFHIPAEVSPGWRSDHLEVLLEITDEGGMVRSFTPTSKDLSFSKNFRTGNRVYERWTMPFPQLEAIGYYECRLSIDAAGVQRTETIFVAICPEKAYIPTALQGEGRAAGISVSLYGIRSEENWGIGDFGDLKKIVDWVAHDLNGSVIGLNPLHALYNRRPFNTSPYLPLSRFYRNFIYLDIPAMEDYQDSPEAQDLVNAPKTQYLLSQLRASETVQYEQVADLKLRVLKRVFRTFVHLHWSSGTAKTGRQNELESYMEREGLLLDNFAIYCALDAAMGRSDPKVFTWLEWPQEYRQPDNDAVQQFQQEHWQDVLFHKYVQWQLEIQLAEIHDYARNLGMGIGLYHDLALAVDRFSADFWANQGLFIPGLRVGAPPDAFSPQGQDWGFPAPNTEKLRQRGYDLFVREIQKNCAFAGALRIDHVMRFFRLYCIPEGEPPSKGAYVSQPFEDMLNLVALESVRNKTIIIGEDLGTVPTYIRETLEANNVLSYRLLYFEKDGQQKFLLPQDYPELALVTVGTHDLPTLAGFWGCRDIKVRNDVGLFDSQESVDSAFSERQRDKENLLAILRTLNLLPDEHWSGSIKINSEVVGELHNAIVGFLALTQAKLFILSQEDLFKETEQQNLPGTTVEYPNWSQRMKYSVDQLNTDPTAMAFCNMFRNWIDRSGRKDPGVERIAMAKKDKTGSPVRPDISREQEKVKMARRAGVKFKRDSRPKDEKLLEQLQRAKIRGVEHKIFKDGDYDKHKKADKKIGGVRGKFHPSMERTRKRT